MTEDLSRAKNWKEGGEGAKSGNDLMRSPETVPYSRMPITEERKSRFLDNLAKFGTVQKAAEMTDGNPDTRRTYMRAMAKDAAFGELAENALAKHTQRRLDVLDEEFFEGTLVPITNSRGLVLDPATKKPIWIRKRDPKIVLAVAKRHDWGLREIKTTINVDANAPHTDNPDDPRIYVQASDLWLLESHEAQTLTGLLKKIHSRKQTQMAELASRPGYLDADDVPYTDITPDLEDPYAIPEGGI